MALVEHDSWEIECEGCEQSCHDLQVQLKQRDQYRDLTPIYDQLTAHLTTGLEQLRNDINHLKILNDAATTWGICTDDELARRRHIWEQLGSQWKELTEHFMRTTRTDRHTHYDQAAGTSRATWQMADKPAPAVGIPSDEAELKRRQMEMIQNQNRGLEMLSETLSRQRALASQLGQEVEEQNDIIDNLSNNMDRLESGVRRETGNIGEMSRRDSSTWAYWFVILSLFVAIVVVALL